MKTRTVISNTKDQTIIDDGECILYYNKHNQLHRTDGPAIIYRDGTMMWCYNGKYHRDDGPAIYDQARLNYEYFNMGTRHRVDGPAVGRPNCEIWFYNGEMHRDDGPARMWDYTNDWFIRNQDITDQVISWMITNKIDWPFNDNDLLIFRLKFL